MDLLLQYLINNGIHKEFALELIHHFTLKKYPKKSLILSMGERTHTICFIIKGLVRGYYINKNGEEIIKCFSKENDWCCIYNMLTTSKSEYYIETLEDSILAEIDVTVIKDLIDSSPELNKLYSSLITTELIEKEKINLHFQSMNAKERYLLFVKDHTDLSLRVNQEYIASYIGITKTSLSRLKKDL